MKTSHTPESWPSLRISLSCLLAFGLEAHAAELANVRAQQRPKTKLVDVFYDLVADEGEIYDVSVSVSAPGKNPKTETLEGDVGEGILPGRNKHIVWDAGTDWPDNADEKFEAVVTISHEQSPAEASMVAITGGTAAESNCGWRLTLTQPEIPASYFEPFEEYGRRAIKSDFIWLPPNMTYNYSITSRSFSMDKTEVTLGFWNKVYNWAIEHGYEFEYRGFGKGEEHPVCMIPIYDAFKWCNARSEMSGRDPAYTVDGKTYKRGRASPDVDFNGEGFRLPSRSEWLWAARGGQSGYYFPCGDFISHDLANYNAGQRTIVQWTLSYTVIRSDTTYRDSTQFDIELNVSAPGTYGDYYHPLGNDGVLPYTTPVGSFPPNPYGLYDMLGNVQEFTYEGNGNGRSLGGDWSSKSNDIRFLTLCGSENEPSPIGGLGDSRIGFRCVHK